MSKFAANAITYSPAYTIVPTYECFNHCSYCNFRRDPGESPWLGLTEAQGILRSLPSSSITEILILSGEVHPQSALRGAWFDLIYKLCELSLSEGFMPHTNAGILSFEEMQQLKQVNGSMGLMLEQVTPSLLKTVHRRAPSKVPQLRLQQLEWAGQLRIPWTTGLLLGIGETQQDREATLKAIAQLHQTWGHIQEVILQPHSPGSQQDYFAGTLSRDRLLEIIRLARSILPPEITLQIPPNLVAEPTYLLACLEAGARDLGGISPKDEVNPDYPHPTPQKLEHILRGTSWQLTPRLPVYPQYYDWLSPKIQKQWNSKL
ncbi:MAG: 7,8-didemethyl-8-hydroxy-5-deazariboflavin synthase subunit CofG [Jaaginema sp. PMC 1079.18]|nr:7,8-didemethyl-8-hydroxy-5-deazariboflavin synthase subunit CofG [Jaaginema sp. PMC 1080.18]MEC4854070.1 7,8-didemethyl-8-hydroxy-5-deazariboflavin synthase subunit CofG [Jaaginema sp. PMC 1079.18]MEC4867436.1 7,8-didemethyl-8-hydroxy-5-deazariboflavin synthase subunit CofG [Jaaginema sp. PMC 1078.18]